MADIAITPSPSFPPSRLEPNEEGSKNLALKKADSDWSTVYDPHGAAEEMAKAKAPAPGMENEEDREGGRDAEFGRRNGFRERM